MEEIQVIFHKSMDLLTSSKRRKLKIEKGGNDSLSHEHKEYYLHVLHCDVLLAVLHFVAKLPKRLNMFEAVLCRIFI
jgi:hypothetical protein